MTRQSDPLRRAGAERGVGRRRDADADAGKTENPRIVFLAGEIMRALARGVADVAEHEEIAERGAGEAREIGRLAGPQAVHEASGGIGRRGVLHARVIDRVGERRIDWHGAVGRERDKALRQIDIVSGERRADFAFGNVAIERPVERLIG